MTDPLIRNAYSQCPFQVLMHDEGGLLGTGTAFLFSKDDETFLITNWHIVSGRHAQTKEPLNGSNRFPLYLQAKLATFTDHSKSEAGIIAHRVNIFDDYTPLWFEHPDLGSACDVVALPFPRPANVPTSWHRPINQISDTRIPVEPGGVTFVVGYPSSISIGPGLPLFKSGYIASEPQFDVTIGGQVSAVGGLKGGQSLPAFFIDALTRPGMSGSPVIASYSGMWDPANLYNRSADDDREKKISDTTTIGSARQFVGCYSGRVSGTEQDAVLGLCWRPEVIRKICEGRAVGRHPHVNVRA